MVGAPRAAPVFARPRMPRSVVRPWPLPSTRVDPVGRRRSLRAPPHRRRRRRRPRRAASSAGPACRSCSARPANRVLRDPPTAEEWTYRYPAAHTWANTETAAIGPDRLPRRGVRGARPDHARSERGPAPTDSPCPTADAYDPRSLTACETPTRQSINRRQPDHRQAPQSKPRSAGSCRWQRRWVLSASEQHRR